MKWVFPLKKSDICWRTFECWIFPWNRNVSYWPFLFLTSDSVTTNTCSKKSLPAARESKHNLTVIHMISNEKSDVPCESCEKLQLIFITVVFGIVWNWQNETHVKVKWLQNLHTELSPWRKLLLLQYLVLAICGF